MKHFVQHSSITGFGAVFSQMVVYIQGVLTTLCMREGASSIPKLFQHELTMRISFPFLSTLPPLHLWFPLAVAALDSRSPGPPRVFFVVWECSFSGVSRKWKHGQCLHLARQSIHLPRRNRRTVSGDRSIFSCTQKESSVCLMDYPHRQGGKQLRTCESTEFEDVGGSESQCQRI